MFSGFYIDLIADYGSSTNSNDLAFTEVKGRVFADFDYLSMPIRHLSAMSVSSFNTIETGFCVAQIAMNSKLKNHIVYHNTAPRMDDLSPRRDNDGEKFAVCQLENGVIVAGVFAGYAFSFLEGAKIYEVKCNTSGSQFRSRDIFPAAVAKISKHYVEHGSIIGCDLIGDLLLPPSCPSGVVVYVDGYGNIKFKPRDEGKFKTDLVLVQIGSVTQVVKNKDAIFSVQHGDMVLANGSSGWESSRMLEVSLRGGSASEKFNKPAVGDKIEVSAFHQE